MGVARAQYRLVTYYENKIHIMQDNPSRRVALLQSAAEQNHSMLISRAGFCGSLQAIGSAEILGNVHLSNNISYFQDNV